MQQGSSLPSSSCHTILSPTSQAAAHLQAQNAGAGGHEVARVVVGVEANEVRPQHRPQHLLPHGERAVDLGAGEGRVQEPAHLGGVLIEGSGTRTLGSDSGAQMWLCWCISSTAAVQRVREAPGRMCTAVCALLIPRRNRCAKCAKA